MGPTEQRYEKIHPTTLTQPCDRLVAPYLLRCDPRRYRRDERWPGVLFLNLETMQ